MTKELTITEEMLEASIFDFEELTAEEKLKHCFEQIKYAEKDSIKAKEYNSKFLGKDSGAKLAFDKIQNLFMSEFNYDISWIKEDISKYSNNKNSKKYSHIDRLFHCYMIHELIQRGSSKAQAIELVKNLIADNTAPTGILAELDSCYKEFLKLNYHEDSPLFNPFLHSLYVFKFKNLKESNNKSYNKTVNILLDYIDEKYNFYASGINNIIKDNYYLEEIKPCIMELFKHTFNSSMDFVGFIQSSDNDEDINSGLFSLKSLINAQEQSKKMKQDLLDQGYIPVKF